MSRTTAHVSEMAANGNYLAHIRRILIVEDEPPAARRLQRMVARLMSETVSEEGIFLAHSVAQAKAWLVTEPAPDVILLDIELSDGTSFELTPLIRSQSQVIFTTAYEHYALQAFQARGLAYLLKPIATGELAQALGRAGQMLAPGRDQTGPSTPGWHTTLRAALLEMNITQATQLRPAPSYRDRFLVREGERFLPLAVKDLAWFCGSSRIVVARTLAGRIHPLDYTLDELEQQLDPSLYFRLNRQYIVSRGAIKRLEHHFGGKLSVTLEPDLKEEILVSREKGPNLRKWLGE